MKKVRCTLCNSNEYKKVLITDVLDGYLVQCTKCGLFYTQDRKEDFANISENINKSCDKRKRYTEITETKLHIDRNVEEKESEIKELTFKHRLKKIRQYIKSGSLIEIGCSTGIFLNAAREAGFDVFGVERDPGTANFARNHFNLNIYTGSSSGLVVEDNSFDTAVLFHVLEHFSEPKNEIESLKRFLKPGGLLVIETPTINNILFKILRRKWRQFIPDHYWFFSENTITKLLEKYQFKVLKIESVGKYVSVRFFLNRLERIMGRSVKILSAFSKYVRLENRVIYVNPRDIMLVFAKNVK